MQYLVTYLRLSEYDMPRADHVEKINWIEQWERDREREIERDVLYKSATLLAYPAVSAQFHVSLFGIFCLVMLYCRVVIASLS